MSELASLQRAFASGLLGQDDAILGHIQPGRFAPDALLQIYRNNFILGLTEVLASSYPAVRAMVGETFFEAAARGFVLAAPLEEGSVMDYGGGLWRLAGTLAHHGRVALARGSGPLRVGAGAGLAACARDAALACRAACRHDP